MTVFLRRGLWVDNDWSYARFLWQGFSDVLCLGIVAVLGYFDGLEAVVLAGVVTSGRWVAG